MKKRIVILSSRSGDWEGFYVDGELIEEAEVLGEGNSRTFLLEQAEKFKFNSDDIIFSEINEKDDEILGDCGNFPKFLSELNGTYDIDNK